MLISINHKESIQNFFPQHRCGFPKSDSFVLFIILEFRLYFVQLDLQLFCDAIYEKLH